MKKVNKGCLVDAAVIVVIVFALIGFFTVLIETGSWLGRRIFLRPVEEMQTDIILPESGVGRNTEKLNSTPTLGMNQAEPEHSEVLRVWSEDDTPLPHWWDPDSAELVWVDEEYYSQSSITIEKHDAGCPDYNIEPEVFQDYLLDVPLDRYLQEFIHDLCEECGLPYTLAIAVIEQESHYMPWIISDTNDWGLMQINEVCHSWLAKELGITNFLDPYQSVRAGIYILGGYYAKIGYASGALMAYNMGEAAARSMWDQGIYSTAYSDRVMGIQYRLETQGQ